MCRALSIAATLTILVHSPTFAGIELNVIDLSEQEVVEMLITGGFEGLDDHQFCFVDFSASPKFSFAANFGWENPHKIVDYDSNSWFLGVMNGSGEFSIYSVSHHEVLWNDYASGEPSRIIDDFAKPFCKSSAKAEFSTEHGQFLLLIE